jgi:hypothetical protein
MNGFRISLLVLLVGAASSQTNTPSETFFNAIQRGAVGEAERLL